jgi:hypothetical protein
LAEFELDSFLHHVVKSQMIANFVADWTLPLSNPWGLDDSEQEANALVFTKHHWTLFFDDSSHK